MKVTIEPHDPEWDILFQSTKTDLEAILVGLPYLSIEHVGSTSVPGLLAKPVLDIDIIVASLDDIPAVRKAMVGAGYHDAGEMKMPGQVGPGRFAFRQPGADGEAACRFGQADAAFGHSEDGNMRRNTYAMVQGSHQLRNHLDCKRVLMSSAALREEYGAVKLAVADRDITSIGEYANAKNEVVAKILREAGWSEEDLKM